jgi:hypothetical protein
MDKMQSGILQLFKAITNHNYKFKSDLLGGFVCTLQPKLIHKIDSCAGLVMYHKHT